MVGDGIANDATDSDDPAELLARVAASGDREAFALLYRRFAPRLASYLRRLGADRAAADELMQEAMIQVWRRVATFDRRQSSVSTWVFTIARNKRIDAIRRERRPEIDPDDPALAPDPEPPADQVVDAAQREARLRLALADLPEEQAGLLRRAFFDGLSHSEIATATGLPLGTVKSRIRLALGRMRKALGDLE